MPHSILGHQPEQLQKISSYGVSLYNFQMIYDKFIGKLIGCLELKDFSNL